MTLKYRSSTLHEAGSSVTPQIPHYSLRLLYTALLAAIILVPVTARASITIQSTDILAVAHVFASGIGQNYTGTNIPTPAPSSLNVSRSEFGWFAESCNTAKFSENSEYITLLVTINHHEMVGKSAAGIFAGAGRTSSPGNDYANGHGKALRFTTDVDTSYEFSGVYEMEGNGRTTQVAMLFDVTQNQILFYNSQISVSTPNGVFTLGESGGDQPSILSGSLTGQPQTGHTYDWFFAAFVGGFAGESGDIEDAKGNFALVLGEATDPGVVPEPTSLLVWGGLGPACLGTFKLRPLSEQLMDSARRDRWAGGRPEVARLLHNAAAKSGTRLAIGSSEARKIPPVMPWPVPPIARRSILQTRRGSIARRTSIRHARGDHAVNSS